MDEEALARIIRSLDPVELELSICKESLKDFVQMAWPYIEPGVEFVPGRHINAICEHLEAVTAGKIRRLVINMPPRHMKSLLVAVAWPCWVWLTRPNTRWMFASYAGSLSVRDSLKCRRLIESDWYQALVSRSDEPWTITTDQNTKGRFETSVYGQRLATSVGGALTGEGGDIIVVDDPHNVVEAESDAIRQTTIDWFNQSMSTRLNNPKTGAIVIVMQRVHEDDLSGELLKSGKYVHLKLPAEYEGDKQVSPLLEDWRAEPGDLLWPERFDRESIDDLKRSLGVYGSAGQLQQRPAPLAGGLFKQAWFRWYDPGHAPKFSRVVCSWDTAVKAGEENDFSAGVVLGEALDGYYLLDAFHQRIEFPGLVKAIKALARIHRASPILIEDKASGSSVLQVLREQTRLPVIPVPVNRTDKLVRAHAVSPVVESGRLFLPKGLRFVDDVVHELCTFPNAKHDDYVDALTQALSYLTKNTTATAGRDFS